jgi:SAM-dependent methyltransferase
LPLTTDRGHEARWRQYHLSQFDHPYRSTVRFCEFLDRHQEQTQGDLIVDCGCGCGANLYHMARHWPQSQFLGVDIDPDLIELGKEHCQETGVELVEGDIIKIDRRLTSGREYQQLGVVSIQTIMMLDWRECFQAFLQLEPDWIAVNSIFYDGPVDFRTNITEYDEEHRVLRNFNYNICPLPLLEELLSKNGYRVLAEKFEIDIDLPRPEHKLVGTYTVDSSEGKLQFTGAMFLPWYFVLARKQ